ncbi:MAG: methyl-accepting chemotaxis protein [Crocosphaera sp.]|nr:methyl-accepting chemotaxis protein [Crocosphaera sp.]
MQTPIKPTANHSSELVTVAPNPSSETLSPSPSPETIAPSNQSTSAVATLMQSFYNLPISRKTQMITALIFLALGGLVGLGSTSLVGSLRSHLLYQTKSQLAVTELNYNSDLEEMGLGFASQAENPTIIEATKTLIQGQPLSPELREQVQFILSNEQKIRNLEYATLVGEDLRIIASANGQREGEVFNPNGLVTQAVEQKKQIRSSESVSWEELLQEKAPLPPGLTSQDALIRYTVTPVKLPGSQKVMGTLISGDIVDGNSDIVQKTVDAFQGVGYSAVYLYHQEDQDFTLATAFEKTELRQAEFNIPLPDTSILKKAVAAQGRPVAQRGNLGNHSYTLAAKAIPNYKGEAIAVFVYGDPELGLNVILKQSLMLQLGLSVAVLGVVVMVAAAIASAITQPIKKLQHITQKFASGNYSARVNHLSNDEVGELGQHFNEMAANIAAHEQGLRQKTQMFRFLAELSPPLTLERSTLDSWFSEALQGARELIDLDRLLIYRLAEDHQGAVIYETLSPDSSPLKEQQQNSAIIPAALLQQLQRTRGDDPWSLEQVLAILSEDAPYREILEEFQVIDQLIIPIFNQKQLYGFLVAHQCQKSQVWQETEINFLQQLVTQLQVTLDRITITEMEALESSLAAHLKEITIDIAQEFNAENLFDLVVQSSRRALNTDRVIVYTFDENWQGTIIAESVDTRYTQALGKQITDPCFAKSFVKKYRQGRVKAISNIHQADLNNCYRQQLESLDIQANLVVPIVVAGELLGLLIAHHCQNPRLWQQPEIDFLTQVALQVGVALERANLLDEQTLASEKQRAAKEALQQRALELLMEVEPISRGDLTAHAQVTEDEIGTIADSYNATVDNLRRLVLNVEGAAQRFSQTTDSNQHLIETLTGEALKQVEQITVVGDRLSAISDSIHLVEENAQQTLSAFEETSERVVAGEKAMTQTVEGMIAIKETVSETTKKIDHLGESSQKISKVVALIGRFAAQTHLLALKASIEAARAGEGGRGFAVIANEVRTLATSSAEATAEIETLVNSIQAETKEVTQTMERGTQQVLEGTELVEQTRDSLTQITAASQHINELVKLIAEAAQDQSLTSKSMNGAMSQVSSIAQNTAISATHLADSFQEALTVAQQLKTNVEQFKVH